MKIEASTVEAHRFARVRRRGYDAIEVDRVMERLVATLQSYEHDTAELEARVQRADDSIESIRRTLAAAQRTRDEMIDEGAGRAATILEEAKNEAANIIGTARSEAEVMMFERDEALIRAQESGATRMAEAEAEAYHVLLDAEQTRASACAVSEQMRADGRAEIDSERSGLLAEAEQMANEVVGAARREEIRLVERLGALRAAAGAVETTIDDLVALTTPGIAHIAEVIDLATVDQTTNMLGSGRS